MSTDLIKSDTTQNAAALIGRILMSGLFIWSGYGKLMAAAGTQAYFASLGLPFPALVWLLAVVVELVGGLALLLGLEARLAAAVLAVWCIVTAIAGHSNFADVNTEINFMKNVAMAGGFGFIATFGVGANTLQQALSRPRRHPAT
jgi:putative oxidoreductase